MLSGQCNRLASSETHRLMLILVNSFALFPKHPSHPVTQEGVVDLEDDKSIDIEDEEPEDPELTRILEESRAAAAKKVEQERLLRAGAQQADNQQETKIKIRVYWEPPPGAHAKWAFAFTYVYQLRSVNTLLIDSTSRRRHFGGYSKPSHRKLRASGCRI